MAISSLGRDGEMTNEKREFLLREHDRMKIEASRMKQIGFRELSRFLHKNAEAALKLAASNAE